jgi:hypothetical protein
MGKIEELKQNLQDLAKGMKPMHLKMAESLAKGNKNAQAYIDAGGKSKDPIKQGSEMVINNPDISRFVELSNSIAAMEAQKAVSFTAEDWLRHAIEVLEYSKGDKERVESVIEGGDVVGEVTHKKQELNVARAMLADIGKTNFAKVFEEENKNTEIHIHLDELAQKF